MPLWGAINTLAGSAALSRPDKELVDQLPLHLQKVRPGGTIDLALRQVPFKAVAPSQGSSSLSLAAYGGKRGKFAGLRNQGATCYLNSLLQAMYMTPDFKHALQQCTASELPALPHALCRLFSELQTSSYAVSTEPFTSTMQWGSVYKQQDVHEFWTCLCERLESELKSHPMHKLIESLFQGKQRDFVTCRECGRTSHTEDVFQDLKLVVPLETPSCPSSSTTTAATAATSTTTFATSTAAATAATTSTAAPAAPAPAAAVAPPATPCVASALAELLKPEEMSGDCQYHCEACARKVDAVRGVELRELPRVLTLQLKRFGYDVRTGQRFKVNTPFPFDTMIDMRPFVAAAAGGGGGGARPAPLLYELYGVLVHAGSANFGHYYAILKDFESSEWFEFNDSRVEPVNESDLRAQFGGGGSSSWSGGSSAYMLLYRQRPAAAAAVEVAGAVVATAAVARGAATAAMTAGAAVATAALGSRLGPLAEEARIEEVPGLATIAASRDDSLAHELKRHCAGQAAAVSGGGGGGCSGGGAGAGGGAAAGAGASAATATSVSEAEVCAAVEGGGEACDMETEETEDTGNPYVSMGF